MIKPGYFFGFFGGQILKASMFSVNFRQSFAENTLNNLD